jgi:hypothetical protein
MFFAPTNNFSSGWHRYIGITIGVLLLLLFYLKVRSYVNKKKYEEEMMSSLECNTKTGKFISGKLARISTLVSNSRMLSRVFGLQTIRSNFAKSSCFAGIF